jgi:adenylosuccinate lyase
MWLLRHYIIMSITSVSPIDGRYESITSSLSPYFSEFALIRNRVRVEIEYFIALSENTIFGIVINDGEKELLLGLVRNFSELDAVSIKEIEKTTNHDVKAIEYWIKDKIKGSDLEKYAEFVHFALTSEDVNNISFTLCYREGVVNVVRPYLHKVLDRLIFVSKENAGQPMLSLTHGQSATPTTFGKEIGVFVLRLQRQIKILENIKFSAKLGGATGTWSAHKVAYPDFDWIMFAQGFVNSFDLEFCPLTTQVVPADSLCESYDSIKRINNILVDLCQDIWFYVERGILSQKKKEGEVGSSAMPHKINPINFENAEGNLQFANSILVELGRQLPVSRMQRDLTGSTVIRNQGVPIAHSIIAYSNLLKGLDRIDVNSVKMTAELECHPEVLAEAIQTYLRSVNYPNAYEVLKDLTRGSEITLAGIREFITSLEINQTDKKMLLGLTPSTYIGLSKDLVEKFVKEF